jgi:hypothetical protein
MCAKNNPADAVTCRFCGARLTPATPQGGAPSGQDWLRDFRAASSEPTNQPGGESDDVPDWLKEVRGSAPSDSAVGGETAPADDLPDWMADVNPSQDASGGVSGLDNWLTTLRDNGEPAPAASEEPATESEPASEDWMANLQSWTSSDDEPASAQNQFAAAQEEQPSTYASGDNDLSAWLKSLDGGEETAEIFSDQTSQPEAGFKWTDDSVKDTQEQQTGVTGWLEGMTHEAPAKEPATPENDAAFQAWMTNEGMIREDKPQTGNPAESLPDWLASGPTEAGFEPPQPVSASEPSPVPDWLSGFAPSEPVQPPAASLPAAQENLPDWLAGFGQEEAAAPVSPAQPSKPQAEELPSWMTASAEPISAEPEPVEAQPPTLDIPDFAALFAEESPAAPEMQEVRFEDEEQEQLEARPQPVQARAPEPQPAVPPAEPPATPDWLSAFAEAGKEAEEPEAAVNGTGPLPFIDEGLPSWLNNVQPPAALPPASSGVPALTDEPVVPQPELETGSPFQVDLPDWLGESQGQEQELQAAETENLTPADIPEWVQDMRPLESIIPGEASVAAVTADQQRVEKAGPLAGMRGVLQPEDMASRFRKLPAYSAKLRISERQRSNAALFQNILDLETQSYAIPSEPSQAPQYIYRLVIAVVLVLALVFGLLGKDFSLFAVPTPGPNDASLLAFYDRVDTLPAGAPVLLAVDYEAGLSGEMKMASAAVVSHLMKRGASLTLVSTVPAGPILANDLLSAVQPGQQAYSLSSQTVNLGYMPGGATSLLQFALDPASAAPVDYQGNAVWNKTILSSIHTIGDYALVVVLTDTTETGRTWLEQLAQVPQNGKAVPPILMVASAQAGPMLMPYYNSGQIKGLVTGFLGGAMYEQHAGSVNLANLHWNSYQSGYVAGILMLILGGIISAVLSLARKPRKGKA